MQHPFGDNDNKPATFERLRAQIATALATADALDAELISINLCQALELVQDALNSPEA